MRVIKLTAENVKRLRAIEITPEGDVVVISGRNGQGKTSVLDSIWFALAGTGATKETPKPIREGEKSATVEVDLGDFVVRRTWHEDKTSLSVMSKDGAKYPSPQRFLDEKLGALSFDPLEFAQMDDKGQLATLLDLVELPFNLGELADERANAYEQRTMIGRDLKALEAQLDALPAVPDGTPDEEVSASALLEEQEAYERVIQEYRMAVHRKDTALAVSDEHRERVAKLERDLAQAQEVAAAHFRALVDAEKFLDTFSAPAPVDVEGKLAAIAETNVNVRAKQETIRIGERLAVVRSQREKCTAAIAAVDDRKAGALAAAKMPIQGLAFAEGDAGEGVTYNGIPFKQCSSAEQLRVSLAMAMAMNPTIRVIRISDGSLLDSENMAVIAEMAQENDFQCWIERVDESRQVGFVIEDGSIAK